MRRANYEVRDNGLFAEVTRVYNGSRKDFTFKVDSGQLESVLENNWILKPVSKGFYVTAKEYEDGVERQMRLHNFALGFLKIKEGLEVHHINEDKMDNRLSNLVLLTRSEHREVHFIKDLELRRALESFYHYKNVKENGVSHLEKDAEERVDRKSGLYGQEYSDKNRVYLLDADSVTVAKREGKESMMELAGSFLEELIVVDYDDVEGIGLLQ